jgi:nucleotide-binding universal stress UspA family protein
MLVKARLQPLLVWTITAPSLESVDPEVNALTKIKRIGVRRALIGSVAEPLIGLAECDTLAVRAPE